MLFYIALSNAANAAGVFSRETTNLKTKFFDGAAVWV
jgi:hypothetical protein